MDPTPSQRLNQAIAKMHSYDSEQVWELVRIANAIEAERDTLKAALKDAERFIANGIEFGYIHMPDPDTPDTAHQTLPNIRAALAPCVPPQETEK